MRTHGKRLWSVVVMLIVVAIMFGHVPTSHADNRVPAQRRPPPRNEAALNTEQFCRAYYGAQWTNAIWSKVEVAHSLQTITVTCNHVVITNWSQLLADAAKGSLKAKEAVSKVRAASRGATRGRQIVEAVLAFSPYLLNMLGSTKHVEVPIDGDVVCQTLYGGRAKLWREPIGFALKKCEI